MTRDGYYRARTTTQVEELRRLAAALSRIYKTPTPEIVFNPAAVPAGAHACYQPMIKTITIKDTSIVSFLHEFRHHIQWIHKTEAYQNNEVERDAQAWACSVFYKASPGLFKTAVQQGRIMGVTAEDLA